MGKITNPADFETILTIAFEKGGGGTAFISADPDAEAALSPENE